MDCNHVQESLEQQVLGLETPGAEKHAPELTDHVRSCRECEKFLADLTLVTEILAVLDEPDIPDNLEKSIISALPKKAPWEKSSVSMIQSSVPRPAWLSWLDSLFTFERKPVMVGAGAALLLVVALSLAVLISSPPDETGTVPPLSDPTPTIRPVQFSLAWQKPDGDTIPAGTDLTTARGETMILTSGGHRLTLRPESAVRLETGEVVFKRGEMLARFAPLPAPYRFITRGYTVEILGTQLGFRSIPGSGIEVAVIEGRVGITSPEPDKKKILLTAYQTSFLTPQGIIGPERLLEKQKQLWSQGWSTGGQRGVYSSTDYHDTNETMSVEGEHQPETREPVNIINTIQSGKTP